MPFMLINRAKTLYCVLFAVSFYATVSAAATNVALAIDQVTVIDPEHRTVLPAHSVLIDGNRITAVLPTAERSKHYRADTTIDGEGKFLIPGLMDMHAHIAGYQWLAELNRELYIANGVTGLRDMASDCWAEKPVPCIAEVRELQRKIEAGELLGPRLLRLSSGLLAGAFVAQYIPEDFRVTVFPRTEAEGRALARELHNRGVDLIKVYDAIPTPAFRGLADQANNLGLEFSGHLTGPLTVEEVSSLGQGTIEHARDLLYDCSRIGPAVRRDWQTLAALKPGDGVVKLVINHVFSTGGMPLNKSERLTGAIEGFDSALCQQVLATLKNNNTYYVPTHLTRAWEGFADKQQALRSDPRMVYLADEVFARWEKDLAEEGGEDPEVRDLARRFYLHGLKLTRLALAAGVKVMVGTDSNDTASFPGFSVHDEMREFAKAGIAPMEILRAATTVPADYLQRRDSFGGVSAGKMADLVLLGKNPLVNIHHTAAIEAVIFNGKHHPRPALDDMLARSAKLTAERISRQ